MNTISYKRINNYNKVYQNKPKSLSQKQVSFKGAEFLVKKAVQFDDFDKLIKIFDKAYDGTGQKLLNELSETIAQNGSRIRKNASSLVIEDKSFFKNLAESALFPITKLPLHILNFLTEVGKKIPGIKKGAQKLYDSKALTKLRNSMSADAKTDMLRGILENTQKAVQPLLKKGETIETLASNPGRIEEVAKELMNLNKDDIKRITKDNLKIIKSKLDANKKLLYLDIKKANYNYQEYIKDMNEISEILGKSQIEYYNKAEEIWKAYKDTEKKINKRYGVFEKIINSIKR